MVRVAALRRNGNRARARSTGEGLHDNRRINADTAPPFLRRKRDNAEDLFGSQCRARRLPRFEREYRFARRMRRQWRFDFAFPRFRVAVEIEGLIVRRLAGELVVAGRHASIKGIKGDMEKYNAAALLGWVVLRFEQKAVAPKRAIDTTVRVLAARGWRP